jgi:hypothetical protein
LTAFAASARKAGFVILVASFMVVAFSAQTKPRRRSRDKTARFYSAARKNVFSSPLYIVEGDGLALSKKNQTGGTKK